MARMEMFLMALCLSVLGLAVTAMAFGAATRPERTQASPRPQPAKPQAQFFVETAVGMERPRVPIEALLLEIEKHVRLEQAAAESFVEYPTAALLHSKTSSTFVN
jgi:hypothetical protein